MDLPPYRARRILCSGTAWAMGLGRPAWILQAYAPQNVLCWVILAVLMTRWLAPNTPRGLALWIACLFAHGLLWSVRFALLDGPSLLLIACAIIAAERGKPLVTAAIVGIAGLGRETNLLASVSLRRPSRRRDWITLAIALGLAALIALTTQVLFLIRRREYASPWWRVAIAFAVLMFLVHRVVWDGYPGAITRIVLAMTFGFNVLLARETSRWFWPWYVVGNLHLIPAVNVLPLLTVLGF